MESGIWNLESGIWILNSGFWILDSGTGCASAAKQTCMQAPCKRHAPHNIFLMRVRVMCLLHECGLFICRIYALMCSSSHAGDMCGLHDYAYVFIPKKCYFVRLRQQTEPTQSGRDGTTHRTHTDGITATLHVMQVLQAHWHQQMRREPPAKSAASLSSSTAMRTRL